MSDSSGAFQPGHEHRCRCGHLLALVSGDGIEIKCRHCKRLEKITLEDIERFLRGQKTCESGSILAGCGRRPPAKATLE